MSSRLYPLYQKGNPQLRIFLTDFYMKLVKNDQAHPPNRIKFICSMGMSSTDVKNYLEKIYNVPVVQAKTFIVMGETRKVGKYGYIVKDDDYKIAHVVLPKTFKFEFPDLFPLDKIDKVDSSDKKQLEDFKAAMQKAKKVNINRSDIPSWFAA